MAVRTPRDPWRDVWQIATGDGLLAALLLFIAAGLTLTAWLPQMPLADPAAYARWLSEAQARFGNATQTMQALGLFTIIHSFGFRALLSLLAGCLLLRMIESGDQMWRGREMGEPVGEWQGLAGVRWPHVIDDLRRLRYRVRGASPLFQFDRWPWADLFPMLAHAGALLVLLGLLLTNLWGWRVEGLIVRSGERVTLAGTEQWVALEDGSGRVTHSSGLVTFVEERGPGVRSAATDDAGRPLPLQPSAESKPVNQLTMALTEDQYFAIPDAQLVVRLTAQSERAVEVHSPVLVQVYRSPPGRLATEIVMEGEMELAVGGVTLKLNSAPYARLTVAFNPGLWPTGAGLVLLLAGLLGSAVWPSRRFWLREEAGNVEGIGSFPPILVRDGGV